MSKLLAIAAQRKIDVDEAKAAGGEGTVENLLKKADELEKEFGKPQSLYDAIIKHWETNDNMAIAAEFKRASPSKGEIATHLDAGEQAKIYANGGAAVVSVLTEPKWFKGSLEDMLTVRKALEAIPQTSQRALVLRKDFVMDEYQLFEARAFGADTVLLIVAILEKELLKSLLEKARELGMEPLVEVACEEEMNVALDVGAKVIGVNNRNLHTFKVDMTTTTRMVDVARNRGAISGDRSRGVLVIALSGIKTRDDVVKYEKHGDVSGVLIGETLMRAKDPREMIQNLIGATELRQLTRVKICGIKDASSALVAAKAGADFIGIIFVKKSKRYATVEEAKSIVKTIREFREKDDKVEIHPPTKKGDWYSSWADTIGQSCDGQGRPLVVGVFMNQPIEEVNKLAMEVGIDMIQLHGDETLEDEAQCSLPVIRVVHVDVDSKASSHAVKENDLTAGPAASVLLDSSVKGGGSGGTGKVFDWTIAKKVAIPVILAGGLTPENVAEAVSVAQPWGVDVASGTESSPGVKDHEKIRAFIRNAKKN
mmetsp:Transcript_4747/g.5478  ORF Transcript_4747/g.5478 Transcript_4747/m.5478 type:complete len:539 (-) Transcript_4747:1143-2759(-)|eukprot:CAMPEP_0184028302 /NCGR_PEP_ID=MMETSP0954-20121128/14737_1 /TAXON_ID=627963 /ORGANISM="Aplanochytrium sp, Strain PBS07" /LENGTH=538 /DNA_ID=CAMNT_0026313075 /DNA_START=51 /DNA_END=1667 /DNA_ORIENTATION=-